MAYASRTGTIRNNEGLKAHGWGVLISAEGAHRDEGFERRCIDPGTFALFQTAKKRIADALNKQVKHLTTAETQIAAHEAGEKWDGGVKFKALMEKYGRGADFAVAPDIVCGGFPSLARSIAWLSYVLDYCPALIGVQDGFEARHVARMLGPRVGIFYRRGHGLEARHDPYVVPARS